MQAIRVLVVDAEDIVRRGLSDVVAEQPDLVVCGEATSAAAALAEVAATGPDVAVIGELPDGDPVSVCRRIAAAFPGTRPLVLATRQDDGEMTAAVVAGAVGYLARQVTSAELVDAVRLAASGGMALSAADTRRVLDRVQHPGTADDRLRGLTDQERRIVLLIADGLSNREIGAQLGLTEKTIKNHVSVLLRKLGLQRRTQAAVLADRTRSTAPALAG